MKYTPQSDEVQNIEAKINSMRTFIHESVKNTLENIALRQTEMEKTNKYKAVLLYNEIDRNPLFRATVADENDRSLMNICFIMNEGYEELEKVFFDFATGQGMIGIKGHRSVGGFRASTYNALPVDSVKALVEVMQEFEKQNA